MNRKNAGIAGIVLTGVFAALIYAGMWLRFPIPSPIDKTAVHLGGILCLLAGFMLGPLRGGLSAGLGVMLFDMTYPGYWADWPFSLVNRFAMVFVCGLVALAAARRGGVVWKYTAAAAGQVTYIILYLTKGFLWDGVVVKGTTAKEAFILVMTNNVPPSLVNGFIAVFLAVPLAIVLQKALKGVPLYEKFHR